MAKQKPTGNGRKYITDFDIPGIDVKSPKKPKPKAKGFYEAPPSKMDSMITSDANGTDVAKEATPFLRTVQTRIAGDFSGKKPKLPQPNPQNTDSDAPDVTNDRVFAHSDPKNLQAQGNGGKVRTAAYTKKDAGVYNAPAAESLPPAAAKQSVVDRSPALITKQVAPYKGPQQGYSVEAPPQQVQRHAGGPIRHLIRRLLGGMMGHGGHHGEGGEMAAAQAQMAMMNQTMMHQVGMQQNAQAYARSNNEWQSAENDRLQDRQAASQTPNTSFQTYLDMARNGHPVEAHRQFVTNNKIPQASDAMPMMGQDGKPMMGQDGNPIMTPAVNNPHYGKLNELFHAEAFARANEIQDGSHQNFLLNNYMNGLKDDSRDTAYDELMAHVKSLNPNFVIRARNNSQAPSTAGLFTPQEYQQQPGLLTSGLNAPAPGELLPAKTLSLGGPAMNGKGFGNLENDVQYRELSKTYGKPPAKKKPNFYGY